MARNHSRSGRWVDAKMVPAVSEVWWRQALHWNGIVKLADSATKSCNFSAGAVLPPQHCGATAGYGNIKLRTEAQLRLKLTMPLVSRSAPLRRSARGHARDLSGFLTFHPIPLPGSPTPAGPAAPRPWRFCRCCPRAQHAEGSSEL